MALINTDRAKEFLPNFDDADEAVLQNLVDAAEAFAKNFCGKDFLQQTYDETYNGTGYRTLMLDHYPVISISRLASCPTDVITIQNTADGVSRATVQVTSTGLTLVSVASGVTTTTSLTFASYVTLTALASAVSAVTGWTAEAGASFSTWASADLRATQGAFNARSRVGLKIHTTDLSDFELNEATGELFLPCGFGRGRANYRAVYSAGYATCPEDLAQAIAELAAVLYLRRGYNPGLQSESLGSYSYTLAPAGSYDALSDMSKRTLQQYRSLRVPEWDNRGY